MANLNFNKVIIGGRISTELELKKTKEGKSVISFDVALHTRGKETDFIKCRAVDKNADFIYQYFKKGNTICIVGRIYVRKWEDKGKKYSQTEVFVDEQYFVDSKDEMTKPNFVELGDDEDLPF